MDVPALAVSPHPTLCLRALAAEFAAGLGAITTPAELSAALAPAAPSPLPDADDNVRGQIRDLLRHGGFKPTGRSKPSSEYLLRARDEGKWPAINAAVDIGNVVSLHSGLPLSVVDLDRARVPLRVALAPKGAQFVFNASGQVIDVGGLLGLIDAEGPCANAVKDAQRTKTDGSSRRVLMLLWGHEALRARVEAAARWAHDLLRAAGAQVAVVPYTAEAAS
jgi:DNA/RNA-binding domain of Phe-tRNA-synthetase-like protein